MLTKFWENIGEELSTKWLEYIFGPAFLFWGMGAVLAAWQNGWQDSWDWLTKLQPTEQSVLVVTGLFLLVFSAATMQHLQFSFLRLLEGYLPKQLAFVVDALIAFQAQRIRKKEEQWQRLKKMGHRNAADKRELAGLEMTLHYVPIAPQDIQPTSLGNVLRAGEMSPQYKYGLDAVVCWPRLWLLLPEQPRTDLLQARKSLDDYVTLWAWGLLALVWLWLTWWAGLAVLIWLVVAYWLALQSARTFTDLLESAFDLHRFDLYKSLHWPLPASTAEEIGYGQKLTEYLWRGTASEPVTYKQEKKEDSPTD